MACSECEADADLLHIISHAFFVIPMNARIQRSDLDWTPAFRRGDDNVCSLPSPSFRRKPESSSRMKQPCIYMLASKRNGTLYVGVTPNLVNRVWQHKNNLVEGFTKKYGAHMLAWFEQHETMESAISREKAIKEWQRDRKLRLIEKSNPEWRDLYPDIV